MKRSKAVREGILNFYERFSAGDPDAFEAGLAAGEGVSVIGSGPGEGDTTREGWAATYRSVIAEMGLKLRGHDPVAFEEGTVGYGTDTPSFVLPDGSTLPTRLTAVLSNDGGEWKVVHVHFSVGVPDEDAIQPPG
jgi:hypothetical protein